MKEYKNIDDLFENNLSDFKVSPSNQGWGKLESDLFIKKKSYYLEILIITALLLTTGGAFWYYNNIQINQQSADLETINNSESNSYQDISATNNDHNNNIQISDSKEIETDIEQQQTEKNHSFNLLAENNNPENSTPESNSSENLEYDQELIIESKPSGTESNNDIFASNSFISLGRLTSKLVNNILDNENPSFLKNQNTIEINQYIEKKRNFHLFTGVSASAGIMYYNDSPDMFTWSSDLAIGYKIKKFYIESGIGYQSVKQHGDYRIDYETNDSVGYYQEVVSFELNPVNQNEIYYNTKTTTVFDSVSHYTHYSPVYQYNYITIPIKFGYSVFMINKFNLTAEAGVIFSMLNNTITPANNFDIPESNVIKVVNNTPTRANNNYSIHMALRLNYNVHKSLTISLQPEFSKYLNSIYENSNNSHKPYSMGIRCGLFFNF